MNVCVAQWVQECCPTGDDFARVAYSPLDLMSPLLDLMSPPLESALLPLECAPLETVQPPLGYAPSKVVELRFGEICAVFHIF